jgi:hypothetical protein
MGSNVVIGAVNQNPALGILVTSGTSRGVHYQHFRAGASRDDAFLQTLGLVLNVAEVRHSVRYTSYLPQPPLQRSGDEVC